MRVAVVGLGLIGGSFALGLRETHAVRGHDSDAATRARARESGIDVADDLTGLLPADVVIIATPLATIVPMLEALIPHAHGAALVEVGSLKRDVAAFAERAPAAARIVGLHPMAGSTASGFAAADGALFRGRPFLVVPTARSDDAAMEAVGTIARDLGGTVTVCSPQVHDRAVAAVSALPLAAAIALGRVAREASPIPFDAVAGTGVRDATRLAATPPDLALPLLSAPGLAEHLASLRSALGDIERALGDERALRDLLDRAHSGPKP
jgi:prephenate dehydrogenase